MNLSNTIIPKSDQLNADDLIAGPITIRVSKVAAGSAEQPVSIHYEGDNGRPYKPGKSMRRVLIQAWGSEGNAYVGRSMTLFRDQTIRFGGDTVGGIRISHLSDIPGPLSFALTVTRGKRVQYTVQPLALPSVDAEALGKIGDAKAAEGREALRSWYGSLNAAEKASVGGKVKAWQEKVSTNGNTQ